ncbi:MAG: hypothetical protein V2B19_17135 [Pseudomonadota bacterium]
MVGEIGVQGQKIERIVVEPPGRVERGINPGSDFRAVFGSARMMAPLSGILRRITSAEWGRYTGIVPAKKKAEVGKKRG